MKHLMQRTTLVVLFLIALTGVNFKAQASALSCQTLLDDGIHETNALQVLADSVVGEPTQIYPFEHRLEIQALPVGVKEAILRQIGEMYPTAKKNGAQNPDEDDPTVRIRHYPKRILDAWIRVLLPADVFIERQIQKGATVPEAYQAYRDLIATKVFSNEMKKMNFGFLKVDDLLEVANQIHQDFQIFKREGNGKNAGIIFYLFGSALKGLEKPGSDIDVFHETGSLPKFYDVILTEGHEAPAALGGAPKGLIGLKKIVQDMMSKKHPDLKLIANHSSGRLHKFDNGSMSALEPIVIEVDEDGVYLQVYSSDIQKVQSIASVYIDSVARPGRQEYFASPRENGYVITGQFVGERRQIQDHSARSSTESEKRGLQRGPIAFENTRKGVRRGPVPPVDHFNRKAEPTNQLNIETRPQVEKSSDQMPLPFGVLATQRTVVRPSIPSDREAIAAIFRNEANQRMSGDWFSPKWTFEEYGNTPPPVAGRDWSELSYSIVLNNQVIGAIEIVKLKNFPEDMALYRRLSLEAKRDPAILNSAAIIAYSLAEAYWGKGLMSEVIAATVDYGRRNLGISQFYAESIPSNIGSQQVLKKAGFKKIGADSRNVYFKLIEN